MNRMTTNGLVLACLLGLSLSAWTQSQQKEILSNVTPTEHAKPHKVVLTGEQGKQLDLVQRHILKQPSLYADFEQVYHSAIGKKMTSKGVLRYKRGGHIRWDYQGDSPKSYIISKQNLWVVSPTEGSILENACFSSDRLSASLSFLWGDGTLQDRFEVSPFEGVFGEATDIHLTLTPKNPSPDYLRLILVASADTGAIKQSIVVDHAGGLNQFKFSSGKPLNDNGHIFSTKDFPGLVTQQMPGACAKN